MECYQCLCVKITGYSPTHSVSFTFHTYSLTIGSLSSQCNYRQNYAVKATDDDWGIVSSESIEEYENLLDLSSTIEPTKTNYNYLIDEWTLGGNDNKKENNTGKIIT